MLVDDKHHVLPVRDFVEPVGLLDSPLELEGEDEIFDKLMHIILF